MKFTSTTYPQLVVQDLGVTFVDGEVEVGDKTVIEGLRSLPAEMGVRAAGGRPPKETTSTTGTSSTGSKDTTTS